MTTETTIIDNHGSHVTMTATIRAGDIQVSISIDIIVVFRQLALPPRILFGVCAFLTATVAHHVTRRRRLVLDDLRDVGHVHSSAAPLVVDRAVDRLARQRDGGKVMRRHRLIGQRVVDVVDAICRIVVVVHFLVEVRQAVFAAQLTKKDK